MLHLGFGKICPEYIDIDLHQKSNALHEECSRFIQSRCAAQAVHCSAAQSLAVYGRGSHEDVIFYKGQTIAEINNSLSDPANGIEDATIFAVFLLICLEEKCYTLTSTPEEVHQEAQQRTVHLTGLQNMIVTKGGLSSITNSRALQALLTWYHFP